MRLLSIAAVLAMAAFALNAADVAGTWKGAMDTDMGTMQTVITLKTGAGVAGTVKVAEFEAPVENARLEGDRISFEINIAPGKVIYEGTVTGDVMKLTVTGTTGNKYALSCKREKS